MTNRTFRFIVYSQLLIILSILALILAGERILPYLAEQPVTTITISESVQEPLPESR